MNSATRQPILTVTVVALALALLAGCAPASGQSAASGSSAAQGSSGTSSTGKASCDEFTSASFAGLVNVPIGKPYVAGSDSAGGIICWYGIGKNAGVTGSRVETLSDDNILITTIGFDGVKQFVHFTGKDVNVGAVTPLDGVGDKAAYNVSALSGNVPELYSYKGEKYCGIQLNVTAAELVSSDPATTAKNEGALCEDAFKHS